MTYSERSDALAEQEDAAIAAADIIALNMVLDEQKDHMVELAQAAQAGDEQATTELRVMRDVRRRNHPRIEALVTDFFPHVERVSA